MKVWGWKVARKAISYFLYLYMESRAWWQCPLNESITSCTSLRQVQIEVYFSQFCRSTTYRSYLSIIPISKHTHTRNVVTLQLPHCNRNSMSFSINTPHSTSLLSLISLVTQLSARGYAWLCVCMCSRYWMTMLITYFPPPPFSLYLPPQLLVGEEVVLTLGCSSFMEREEWTNAFDVFKKMALPVKTIAEHPLPQSTTDGRGWLIDC